MKRAAAQVGGAAIIGAIVGYLGQFFAARWLGPAQYADFAVFWGVLFTMQFALGGIPLEVTRLARLEKLQLDLGEKADRSGPRLIVVMAAISLAASAALLASGPLWAPAVLGVDWWPKLLLLAPVPLLTFPSLAAGGVLAGMARWRAYAAFSIVEGVVRLVLFLLAVVFLPTVLAFCAATVLAFLSTPLVVLAVRRLRDPVAALRSDVPAGATVSRMLRAMLASGLSGVLLNGTAAVLATAAAAVPRGVTPAELGVLVLLVTLTRAPLLVPIAAFQTALIARFTGLEESAKRRWIPAGIGLLAVATAVLAGLAALVGPPLLPILFGDAYVAGPGLFASLVGASFGLAVVTLTGMVTLSESRHTAYLVGWMVAIGATIALVWLLPIAFEWATVIALGVGPLLGAGVHLVAIRRPRPVVAVTVAN